MRKHSSLFYLRIRQTSSSSGKSTEAWALDNFSILGTGPEYVSDDFDPTTSCHWLAHTGTVKVHLCLSRFIGYTLRMTLCLQALKSSTGNALTFSGIPVSSVGHFVTSIPLTIQDSNSVNNPAKVLFEENFDPAPSIP